VLVRETEEKGQSLKRVVGLGDLTALGLGAIIGTGIFVVIGEAIASSGPLIIFSFVLAGITCAFSALCCAELSSSIPVAGSAYTYAYATMGELAGWIIGWDLILEYGVSVVAVAVGWGEYLNIFLDTVFGYSLPEWIAGPPGEGGTVNLPAVFIVLAIMTLLVYGVRESARANSMMVLVKIAALLMFIVVGVTAFDGDNFSPFYGGEKEGISGVVTAASIIFFAYIGFDAISTSGEETKNAGRDLPIAILASLGVATLLYILVAVVAVGALPSDQLADSEAPLAAALRDGAGVEWGASLIAIGALVSITSVVLTIMYGQTRIFFAMPRRPRAAQAREGAPALSDADPDHGRVRALHRVHRRRGAARRDRRAGQHRHAVRVPDLQHRGRGPATHAAQPAARLPRPVRAVLPDHRRRALHLPDDRPAGDDVVALPDLARDRLRDLLPVWPPSLAPAAGRGRGRRGGAAGGARVALQDPPAEPRPSTAFR
jgi:APA family basic amino acid/polyamine antiporter